MKIKTRKIKENDWHDIMLIQQEAYKDEYAEDYEVLYRKVALSPDTCFVAIDEKNNISGCLITHLYPSGKTAPLNEVLDTIPNESDCLYIHDLAISQKNRGQGIANTLLNTLQTVLQEKNINDLSLVAIDGAHLFWQKIGFLEEEHYSAEAFKAEYGEEARLMKATKDKFMKNSFEAL